MALFLKEEGVEQYEKMLVGYDASPIFRKFYTPHLNKGDKVLELGSGPGGDCKLYQEAGVSLVMSDFSPIWQKKWAESNPDGPEFRVMNAITLDTVSEGEMFDTITSNKVLIHLEYPDALASLAQQAKHLKKGGLAIHTWWAGEEDGKTEDMHGALFCYHKVEGLKQRVSELEGNPFEWVSDETYTEMEENDSFCTVLRKK